jgi:secreted PhoX family phosphatase
VHNSGYTGNNRIRKINSSGVITTVAGNGDKTLKVSFLGEGIGSNVHIPDVGQATMIQLNFPHNIAVDHLGGLFISDDTNHCIRKVTLAGVITRIAGNGIQGYSGDGGNAGLAQLNHPSGLAVDSAGNLYIVDGGRRIRKVSMVSR